MTDELQVAFTAIFPFLNAEYREADDILTLESNRDELQVFHVLSSYVLASNLIPEK